MKDKIATMSADIFALESMTYLTTGLVDAGRTDFSIESAICKVFGSETLWRVANESRADRRRARLHARRSRGSA